MNKPIEYLRALCRDIVQNAQSGHIGMSLGASTLVYTLYKNFLKINPKNPDFIDRDRVVFSAGHCTPLIYSILHLCGYDITLNDLRCFRSLGSCTKGHPEIQTCGVDCTTGPLGQGFATAVGLAIAEKHLANVFNKQDLKLFDHYTYVILGDGCLMEGVSYESASIAGELKLSKLIALYDSNQITLDGQTNGVFSEDIKARFIAQGWDVFEVEKIDDEISISNAIIEAKLSDKPSLVIVPSVIGLGLQDEGNPITHSCKISRDECYEYREKNGLTTEAFSIPQNIYKEFQNMISATRIQNEYEETLYLYKKQYKKEYELYTKYLNNDFKVDINLSTCETFSGINLGHVALNALSESAKNIIGGSADVSRSTKARILASGFIDADNFSAKNLKFGVREFAMACISNGIAIHGGLVPFCSTFLAFSDYMKPAIRLSALMHAKVLYIFSHDTIKVGKDGPTHEPVEQIDMLRSIPNLQVFRPCCGTEVAYAYAQAYEYDGPTAIILSKGELSNLITKEKYMQDGVYCVYKGKKSIANIFASGEDMNLALKVLSKLRSQDLDANLYSILKSDNFTNIQKNSIKTNCVIECASAYTLQKFVGNQGLLFCVREFGQSGDGEQIYKNFNFDEEIISKEIVKLSIKNDDCIYSTLY